MAQDTLAIKQKVGLLQQDKTSNHWGNPADTSAAFHSLGYDAGSIQPDFDIQVDQYERVHGNGITEEEGRNYVDKIGGMPKLSFSGLVAKELLAPHLAASVQKITEGGSPPYGKSLEFNDSIPDFANNGGFLFTLALANYTAGGASVMDGIKFDNCILDNYSITMENNARSIGRLMRHSGTWIASKYTPDQIFADTDDFDLWVDYPSAPTHYNGASDDWTLQLVIGSSTWNDISCWRSFTLNINNQVNTQCRTTGGEAGNYRIEPVITSVIELPYNSDTYKAIQHYGSGDNVSLSMANGTGTSDGELEFDLDKGVLITNPYVYEGKYQAIRIETKHLRPDSAGWNNNIDFADGIDWGF
jgi:hypothetical protein